MSVIPAMKCLGSLHITMAPVQIFQPEVPATAGAAEGMRGQPAPYLDRQMSMCLI